MLYEYYVSCVIWVCLERAECRGDSVWVSQVVEYNKPHSTASDTHTQSPQHSTRFKQTHITHGT